MQALGQVIFDVSVHAIARGNLIYDPETGFFYRLACPRKPALVGKRAGSPHKLGFRQIGWEGRKVKEHHLAWFFVHGVWPKEIDHIDLNPANNAIGNLRLAEGWQNCGNQRRPRSNTSGIKNVNWMREYKKWKVEITVKGKRIYLGCYEDKAEAARVADSARRLHFGEFARAE